MRMSATLGRGLYYAPVPERLGADFRVVVNFALTETRPCRFCGLSDRNVFLAQLCALCAVLSHGPMLDRSETPRKPSDGILALL